jgi:dihydroneopterin aldolase
LQGKVERSVFIEGMRLHLKCGTYPEERSLGVQVKLSVKLTGEFVDYQELHNLILRLSRNTYTYLEEFQEALLKEVLNRWNIDSAIIETVKLSVPFQHNFERVGVELRWRRK